MGLRLFPSCFLRWVPSRQCLRYSPPCFFGKRFPIIAVFLSFVGLRHFPPCFFGKRFPIIPVFLSFVGLRQFPPCFFGEGFSFVGLRYFPPCFFGDMLSFLTIRHFPPCFFVPSFLNYRRYSPYIFRISNRVFGCGHYSTPLTASTSILFVISVVFSQIRSNDNPPPLEPTSSQIVRKFDCSTISLSFWIPVSAP